MDDLMTLKKLLHTYLNLIFKAGLILVISASFFLLANLTTDISDTPKFLILLIFTAVMLILTMLKFTVDGKVVFVRTPLDIPLLLLLTVGIISTILSPAPYVSILGNSLKVNNSLVSLIVYVLFYFMLVNSLKGEKQIKWILGVIAVLAQILAVVSLLSYAGIKILPSPWITTPNFTPAGSSFSTAAILALLLPFILMNILLNAKPLFIILNSVFLLVSGITIALTGSWPVWVAAVLGLGLTVAVIGPIRQISLIRPIRLIGLIGPISLIALITLLSFIPPFGKTKNPLYNAAKDFPREIQADPVSSWKIAVSSFRDSPFWGTGPATYLFDFTNYKPVEFNSTKLWNLRFDFSFNEYLQVLATLGGVGLVALLSLTALFISAAYRTYTTYLSNRSDLSDRSDKSDSNKVALAISGLVFFVILALHPATLPLLIIGILILAAFMVSNLSNLSLGDLHSSDIKTKFLQITAHLTGSSSAEEIRVDALPGILLTVVIALVIFTGFFGGKLVVADYHHRLALNAISQNQGVIAYNELIAAEKLNPYSDLYHTDLAQTNFALANAIAFAKGPTQSSPSGSLTDTDKQNIQVLLQQSINEGRTAVALSPKSAVNWEILALLYRQIAGVAQNALVFSLDSYGRAIFQDPLNPNLRLSVGGVYYAVKNYDMAIRFFTDAINLKPDFANGYYNLSVALRDKGDLANAQILAEKVLTLVDKNSPDDKVANDYLNDLKSRNTTKTTESPAEPPAAKTSGALQEKSLPKVINLPKPEKIATPEAIKKPEPTPAPSPTVAP